MGTYNQNEPPYYMGYDGTVIEGTYKPDKNEVDVVLLETYANFEPGIALTGTLMTDQVGSQYGPQGGERCHIFETRSGYRILINHGFDPNTNIIDTPQTPVGEYRRYHAAMGTTGWNNVPVWNSGHALTNDGPTPDDGLGGSYYGNVGALTQVKTGALNTLAAIPSGERTITLNDTLQTITTITPTGLTGEYADLASTIKHQVLTEVYTVLGGALAGVNANSINHIAPGVGLGGIFSQLPTNAGAINNDILTTFGNNINQFQINNLNALVGAMVTAGVPNVGAVTLSIIENFLQKVVVPPGSGVVKILTNLP